MDRTASAQAASFCADCGNVYGEADRFCQRCGKPRYTPFAEATQKPTAMGEGKTLIKSVVWIVSVIALATGLTIGFFKATEVHADPRPEAPLIARAEADVRSKMNDPDSATFKDVIGSVEDQCVMGSVLGKNGFGALSGYQDFVWQKGAVLFDDGTIFGEYFRRRQRCMDKHQAKELDEIARQKAVPAPPS